MSLLDLSFTGPSNLSISQQDWVVQELRHIDQEPVWRSGAAHGVDTLVYLEARWCALYYPSGLYFNRHLLSTATDPEVVRVCAVPGGYRRRNIVLVTGSGRLHAFVLKPKFYRSGEWMTINIAKNLEVPVVLHHIQT